MSFGGTLGRTLKADLSYSLQENYELEVDDDHSRRLHSAPWDCASFRNCLKHQITRMLSGNGPDYYYQQRTKCGALLRMIIHMKVYTRVRMILSALLSFPHLNAICPASDAHC